MLKPLATAALLMWPAIAGAQTKADITSALTFFDQMAAASRAQDGLAFMTTHTPDAVFLPNRENRSAAQMRAMLMEVYGATPRQFETMDAQVYKTRAIFGAEKGHAWAAVPFKTVMRTTTGEAAKETCVLTMIFRDANAWFFMVRGPGGLHPALAAAFPDLAVVPLDQEATCVDVGS